MARCNAAVFFVFPSGTAPKRVTSKNTESFRLNCGAAGSGAA
jgi:hypothetical protein